MAARDAHGHDVFEKSVPTSIERQLTEENGGSTRNSRRAHVHDETARKSYTLRRLFNHTQLLMFALTFMSSWEVMAMNMGAAFVNGGPRSLVWGCLVVVAGALTQALSLAEMAAMQPIAGAQYHWTALLAPKRSERFITWLQGWVTWFAWVAALGGNTSGLAMMLTSLASYNYPDSYVFHSWHITVIGISILILSALINMYAFRTVPWIETLSGILHIIIFIVIIVILCVLAPKSSPDFVFFDRTHTSGWSQYFVSWNIGMLVPAWGFIGFDGVVHMSEEVRSAKHAVPRAMISTIIINGVMAWAFILVALFTTGDLEAVLESVNPIIPISIGATGSVKAGTAMCAGVVIIEFCVVIASLASVSRITWAWARDGALPRWFSVVHPKHKVPVRATVLPVVIVCLLSLLNVNSTSGIAFSVFTSLSSLGINSSYIIALCCMLHARLGNRIGNGSHHPIQLGEWQLWEGWGMPLNVVALFWTMYATVWLPFPLDLPVDAFNMNYSLPIYVAVVVATLVYWLVHGNKYWSGINSVALKMAIEE